MKYKFKDYMYQPPYAEYYNKYYGHYFILTGYGHDSNHWIIQCITSLNIVVDGLVHGSDMEPVEE